MFKPFSCSPFRAIVFLCGLVTASGASSASACRGVKNFTQLVDHTGASTGPPGTFLQQYQLDTSRYKPNGPILFFQGNEGATMFCTEELILPEWATELGAAVATLEHRFFGNSVPSNASDPTERFKTLTLDNVMWDSVNFINWVKKTIPGGNESKVIVQGASYGAALSSWLRLNHPDTFYGAISSAAPLRGYGFGGNNPESFGWQSWISHSLSLQSAEAATKIKNAYLDLSERILTPTGRAGLKDAFNLCSAPDSTTDGALLLDYIKTTYGFATQFNFGSVQNPVADKSVVIGYTVPTPLAVLINRTLAIPADDSLQILNASLSLYMDQFPGCIDYTIGQPPVPGIETSVFNYITCTYLPLVTPPTLAGGIFPPVPLNVSLGALAACKKSYNTTGFSQAELQNRYHFTQQDVQDSTRLLLVAGEYDPTSGVMPSAWDYPPSTNATRILYVSEMGHCEDTYKTRAGDNDSVQRARRYELETIKGWLGC